MVFEKTNLSADGIQDSGLNTEERNRSGARLGLNCTRERRHNDGTSLSLPAQKSNEIKH